MMNEWRLFGGKKGGGGEGEGEEGGGERWRRVHLLCAIRRARYKTQPTFLPFSALYRRPVTKETVVPARILKLNAEIMS